MKIVFFGIAGSIDGENNPNTMFAVLDKKNIILIDCSGSPISSLKKAGINPSELDALILTHGHIDHIYGLPSLIHQLWLINRKKLLYIMLNNITYTLAKEICRTFSIFSKDGLFPIEWVIYEKSSILNIGNFKIELFPVDHSIETSGTKITNQTSFVYSSDTKPSKNVIERIKFCDTLIHEASGKTIDEKKLYKAGHSSIGQAAKIAKKGFVKNLFLCHLDFHNPQPENIIKKEAEKIFSGKIIIPKLYHFYEV